MGGGTFAPAAVPSGLSYTLAAGTTSTINTGSNDFIWGSVLPGGGGLDKTGSGTLTLTAANTYSGGTTIDEGMLVMGVAGAVPDGADLTVNGTLDLYGNSLLVENFSGADSGIVTSSQPGRVTLTVAGNGETTTFSGILEDGSGQLALAKTGSSTLLLAGDSDDGGANAYTGGTTVSAGTLLAETPGALPGWNSPLPPGEGQGEGGAVTVAGGATLGVFAANWSPAQVSDLLADASFASGSSLGLDVPQDQTAEWPATIAGSVSLIKLGEGTLTLDSAESYTGGTTVLAGTLVLGQQLPPDNQPDHCCRRYPRPWGVHAVHLGPDLVPGRNGARRHPGQLGHAGLRRPIGHRQRQSLGRRRAHEIDRRNAALERNQRLYRRHHRGRRHAGSRRRGSPAGLRHGQCVERRPRGHRRGPPRRRQRLVRRRHRRLPGQPVAYDRQPGHRRGRRRQLRLFGRHRGQLRRRQARGWPIDPLRDEYVHRRDDGRGRNAGRRQRQRAGQRRERNHHHRRHFGYEQPGRNRRVARAGGRQRRRGRAYAHDRQLLRRRRHDHRQPGRFRRLYEDRSGRGGADRLGLLHRADDRLRRHARAGVNAQSPVLYGLGADIQGGKVLFDYTSTDPAAAISADMDCQAWPSSVISTLIHDSNPPSNCYWWPVCIDDPVARQVTATYTIPGDANLDGTVNVTDLDIVLAHTNETGLTWLQGNFDDASETIGDGDTVDLADLTIVLANYNVTAAPSAPQVVLLSRIGASPTTANTLRFVVAFSQDVTGVSAADFQLRVPTPPARSARSLATAAATAKPCTW